MLASLRATMCVIAGASVFASSFSVCAQEPGTISVQAYAPAAAPQHFLPANTEILLSMNQDITTKGKSWSEGDNFDLSVVHDVMLGEYVVIPRGTRAKGHISWLTSKGAFGKSGKMDIELDYLELSGQRIDLNGTYRQEGEGNTVATVGGVIAAGVFAGFITGKSAKIPQGRELVATTEFDLPVTLPAGAKIESAKRAVTASSPAPAKTLDQSEAPARADSDKSE